MSVYVVVQVTITDRARYDRYQARFMEVFAQFSGELIANDEQPQLVEGQSTIDKIVLMRFPDKQGFFDWATSPQYQAIVADRQAGADLVVHLAESFSLPMS